MKARKLFSVALVFVLLLTPLSAFPMTESTESGKTDTWNEGALPDMSGWDGGNNVTSTGALGMGASSTIRTTGVTNEYGLIFNATGPDNGKFYLDANGNGTIDPTENEYTGQPDNREWDKTSGKLTLKGFEWITDAETALIIIGDITLVLEGTNTFKTTDRDENCTLYGIRIGTYSIPYNLTITGDGTLYAIGGSSPLKEDTSSYGIEVFGNLIIENGIIHATGGTVVNNSYGVGVYNNGTSGGNFTMNGGILNASGGEAISSAGFSLNGEGNLINGTLNASGVTAVSESYGIRVDSTEPFTVKGGTLIAAGGEGGASYGVYNYNTNGDFIFESGTVTAHGNTSVFYNSDNLQVTASNYAYKTGSTTIEPDNSFWKEWYKGEGEEYIFKPVDKFVKLTTVPFALVNDGTIPGTVGTQLPGTDKATIRLYLDEIKDDLKNAEIPECNWFNNLPDEITLKADISDNGKNITLTFGGTPTEESKKVFDITIPSGALASNAFMNVEENDAAKFDIDARIDAAEPKINNHPTGATYTVNAMPVALTVAATSPDGGGLSYQWYSSTTNDNTKGTPLGQTAQSESYTPSTATIGTVYYYCIVTNTNNSVNGTKTAVKASNAAELIVSATYTITFDANGGTVIPTSAQTGADGKLASLPTPTRSGSYRFDGWFMTASGGTDRISMHTVFTTNTTVYAHWTYINGGGGGGGGGSSTTYYTVMFETNGGSSIQSQHLERNHKAVKPLEPVKEGFTFAGWYADKALTTEYDFYKGVTSNISIYAKWTENAGTSTPDKTDRHEAYIVGYPDGNFGPNSDMTRAEAVMMLYNLLGNNEMTQTATFPDIPDGKWYTDAVRTLAGAGILKGYPDGLFRPDANITRAEFMSIVTRFADAEPLSKSFPDISESHWAFKAINTASGYGWIDGYPDGTFKPDRNITRAEAVKVINRVLDRKADKAYIDGNLGNLGLFADVAKEFWAYYEIMEAANTHDYKMTDSAERWTSIEPAK